MIDKVFEARGTFGAIGDAEAWCRENGVSVGSMCGPLPMGLMWGEIRIAKWRNLDNGEIKRLHGRLESEDFREGSVRLRIMEKGEGLFPDDGTARA